MHDGYRTGGFARHYLLLRDEWQDGVVPMSFAPMLASTRGGLFTVLDGELVAGQGQSLRPLDDL